MEFDVKMNASVLYDYMMHHTYSGFLGVFGSAIGALFIVLFAVYGNVYCGIMGIVEIPTINVSLPVYHGTSEEVLQVAIGHIEWTSLPTGGIGNHCVVSGHRGLPSAKLFTNLDQLKEGDVFVLYVLNEAFAYEVDQIRIVEPDDLTNLRIEQGEDLCTLVTCTPYAVNSHRLLVRGHRVETYEVSEVRVTADATQLDDTMVAMVVAIPILLGMFIWLMVYYRKR